MAGYSAYTDQELIALLKQGDKHVFNEIHHRCFDALFRSAYNVLINARLLKSVSSLAMSIMEEPVNINGMQFN